MPMRWRNSRLPRCVFRRALLTALLPLATGCADVTPPGPTPAITPVAPIAPAPPPPLITGSAARYQRVSPLTYGASDAYLLSLGSDSAFVIIFSGGATDWAWSGRYSRTDSMLVFHYNAWSAAGELGARGTLHGDTLFLRYNVIMQLTDFEDGTYVRVPAAP